MKKFLSIKEVDRVTGYLKPALTWTTLNLSRLFHLNISGRFLKYHFNFPYNRFWEEYTYKFPGFKVRARFSLLALISASSSLLPVLVLFQGIL